MSGLFFMVLLSSADLFNINFKKKKPLINIIIGSDGLSPNVKTLAQIWTYVGTDLGPNCLQTLSADKTKFPLARKG